MPEWEVGVQLLSVLCPAVPEVPNNKLPLGLHAPFNCKKNHGVFITSSVLFGAELKFFAFTKNIPTLQSVLFWDHLPQLLLIKPFWISNQRLIMQSFGPWRLWGRKGRESSYSIQTWGKSCTSQCCDLQLSFHSRDAERSAEAPR